MPRPALTSEQRRETRRLIRQAAAELYAQNGLADISARAIANKAGVSVGTLYAYFDNLTELMQSLWKQPVVQLLAELALIADCTPEPTERLRKLLVAYATFACQQHGVYRGAFMFVRPNSHDKPVRVRLKDDRFYSMFRKAIADGQKQGVFRSGNPGKLTQTVWATLHGSIALPTNLDRLAFDPPEKLARQAIDMVLEWLATT